MIEFSERLSYFGIATSLMLYLTKVLQEEMKVAAKNVNYWMSVTTLMPLLGGFLADGYLGRFSTVVFSTAIYRLVMSSLRSFFPPPCMRTLSGVSPGGPAGLASRAACLTIAVLISRMHACRV